jgi:MoaA/NifB/PqqE/SkfB family radical SAM enzyme
MLNLEVKTKLTERQIKRHKRKIAGRLAIAAKNSKDSGGKPFILNFSTTLKCNCNCESCLWRDNSAKNELTAEEIKRIHLEAGDEGFVMTILWGGEPTLRKDIADIIKFIKNDADFAMVALVSNGFLLPKRISEFGDDLDFILLSLDSPVREEHDEIRGLPGLYDRIMESVKIIKRDYPLISLQFSFSISKYNIHRVPLFNR